MSKNGSKIQRFKKMLETRVDTWPCLEPVSDTEDKKSKFHRKARVVLSRVMKPCEILES